jgi:hypothetical protein
MREIRDSLHDEGLWIFEQSYMPTMLDTNAYDTICQEHLEYYALRQVKWMTDRVGFKIVNVELNDVNGGSFSIAVAKRDSSHTVAPDLDLLLHQEDKRQLDHLETYRAFAGRVEAARAELREFLSRVKRQGKRIYGLGASTKGNVILQYCGITPRELECIGEVNSDKFGCFTPGSYIPILPEDEVLAMKPDYLLVLPWHFRRFFESSRKFSEFRLVFPLPRLEVGHEPSP